MNLHDIHVALADAIRAGIARDVTVYAWPQSSPQLPAIEVWPSADWVTNYWGTFGPNGTSEIAVRIKITPGSFEDEDAFIALCDLASVGVGAASSVADAVMSDTTLGGAVHAATPRSGEWDPDEQVLWIDVDIIARKEGAEA